MITRTILLFLSLLCLPFPELLGEKGQGTLVVTYGTGEESIRLSRVRFWLISNQGSYRLFPNGNNFVDDPITNKRMVLIENLPEGSYTVKFIFPNSDNLFEKVENRTISLKSGGVVKIDQQIHLKSPPLENLAKDTHEIVYEPLDKEIAYPLREVRFYSSSYDRINQPPGYLNIKNNIPIARWILSRDGVRIATGEGSAQDLVLPSGSGYKLSPQLLDNYEVKVQPSTPFSISSTQTQTVEITYKKMMGTVQVLTNMPSSDQITITIEGANISDPIQTTQIARQSQIDWKSPPLPLGTYILTVKAPVYYEDIPPIKIDLKQAQNVLVKPKMRGANKILVTTNSSDAVFVLKEEGGPFVMEGTGDSYQFSNLFPGTYTLTFSTANPGRFIPPRPKRITLSKFKPEEEPVYAEYTFAGTLRVKGNIPRFIAKIESKKGEVPLIREEISQYSKDITLPEGQWRVIFTPYYGATLGSPLPAQDIFLDAFEIEELSVQFVEQEEREKTAAKASVGVKSIEDLYQNLLFVPAGLSILGDPYKLNPENSLPANIVELSSFEISKFEVTNGQFESFLNSALQEGIILLSEDEPGVVRDLKKRVLFHTLDLEKDSQISYTPPDKIRPFQALPGFENYPVIFVTWYGANAFCDYFSLRLPTESEWERAASIASEPENPSIKKWIYGFSKDTIDRSLANYRYDINTPYSKKVQTTPVGFYNGINTLPLMREDREPKKTENAVSPIGAYDMSGNVFEWVSDWYSDALRSTPLEKDYKGPSKGSLKVAKGGCYDSLADGVRSFERIGLTPDHTDACTGFRAARTPTAKQTTKTY